ncbi:MAG: hypothetical protein AAGC93_17910 [Cyanobacteria bacterium P01_F01_bin.53]
MYKFFDSVIQSSFALPGLIEIESVTADLKVGLVDEYESRSHGSWHAVRYIPAAGLVVYFSDTPDESCNPRIRISSNEGADFFIDGFRILCRITNSCDEGTLTRLLLQQVIPRVLSHSGKLVWHASAVELGDGRTIAFLGESGSGKSTLATALQLQGGELLADDVLSLSVRNNRAVVAAGHSGLWLRESSLQLLRLGSQELSYFDKGINQLFFASAVSNSCCSRALDEIYILKQATAGSCASAEELAGIQQLTVLMKHAMPLVPLEGLAAAKQLSEMAAIATAIPRIKTLQIHRKGNSLNDACSVIMAGD